MSTSGEVAARQTEDLSATVLLVALGISLFVPSLAFIPVFGDDFDQLVFVRHLENPLSVLWSSWWGAYPYYRPLHTLLLWSSERVFGVAWWPNQLFSLLLHLANTVLLFRLARRYRAGVELSFGISAFYLVSIHVVKTVTWVAARSDLLVGMFLLLLVLHIARREDQGRRLDVWVVALLTIGALMSKESGVVVPLLAAIAATRFRSFVRSDIRILVVVGILLLTYTAMRVAIFGVFAEDPVYETRPVLLLGGRDLTSLPPTLENKMVGYGENFGKYLAAQIVPVFSEQGLPLPAKRLATQSPLWILVPVIFVAAVRRRMPRQQQLGLSVIVLCAFVHSSFYATYLLYLGHIGLCLFLAVDPAPRPRILGKKGILVAYVSVILVSMIHSGRHQVGGLVSQRVALERWVLEGPPEGAEPELAALLLERYGARPRMRNR